MKAEKFENRILLHLTWPEYGTIMAALGLTKINAYADPMLKERAATLYEAIEKEIYGK